MRVILMIIAALSLLLSCTQPEVDLSEVRKAVEQGNKQLLEAFHNGDAQAISMVYTENATLMPPGMPAVTGRNAIRENWAESIETAPKEFILETIQIDAACELAYETGSYVWVMDAGDGSEIRDTGKYVVVWKKTEDGSWKMHIDIWNSDQR